MSNNRYITSADDVTLCRGCKPSKRLQQQAIVFASHKACERCGTASSDPRLAHAHEIAERLNDGKPCDDARALEVAREIADRPWLAAVYGDHTIREMQSLLRDREDFRVDRGYSTVELVAPRETYIWAEFLKWLTWGPEFLASVRAARA